MFEQMKEHYGSRIRAIFTYTNSKWYYVALKTLCVIVGAPLYFALLPVDFLIFIVYALFSWVPILSVFMLALCKILNIVTAVGYYIAIIPDAKAFINESKRKHAEELEAERLADEVTKALDASETKEAVENAENTELADKTADNKAENIAENASDYAENKDTANQENKN